MTEQPASPLPADADGMIRFSHVIYWKGQWWMTTSAGDALLSSLVGRVVNIGDKDGGVYEEVTVTGLDERTGDLAVTGGGFGQRFRDSEASPFEGTRTIAPHDIARGFTHPARTGEEHCS